MKHGFLSIVALFLFPSVMVCAQDFSFTELDKEKKVSISMGVIGDLNISTLRSGANDIIKPDFSYKAGYGAGVGFQLRFMKRNERSDAETGLFAIQPEIKYVLLGANYRKSVLGQVDTEGSISFGYVMIPVMIQYFPKKYFFIELGPEFTFNVYRDPETVNVGTYNLNFSNLSSKDVMLGVGIGIDKDGYRIGIRYNHGYSEYAKNIDWSNSSIQLTIGYFLKTDRKKTDDFVLSL